MKILNDFLFDNEDEEKEEKEKEGGENGEDKEPEHFHGIFGPLTKEEIEERGFSIKTIRFTPFDLVLLLISMFLFTVAGCGMGLLSTVALLVSAPLYAVFSYKIGNNFSFFVPLAALIASGFITQNPVMPLGALLATAMSYIILHCVNNISEGSKAAAVVRCSVAMGAYLVAAFIVSEIMGNISVRELLSYIDKFFLEMEAQAYQAYSEFAKAGMDFGMTDADIKLLAEQFATSSRAVLPAVAAISFMMLSYVSASLLPLIAKLCGTKNMLSNTSYEIKLSKISVVVYLIAWLGAFLGAGTFGYACRNLTAILSPALSLCGIKQIGEFLSTKGVHKIAAALIQCVCIASALVFGDIGLSVLIMFGVFRTLRPTDSNNFN